MTNLLEYAMLYSSPVTVQAGMEKEHDAKNVRGLADVCVAIREDI